eukprot:CAMPEP_0170468380 /NCGR_PEP_ID=MMETSP0123-20130129/11586_1 /TAXON_ID=182087 /ORGANISM="Favella ehrenbergii, Strain Fehren 1" /LENGTH=80 /DNA_ID=CAMNT_0010734943 /DNA_START=617 /DNA_END=859 /DNA_ORIENTATION=-
MKKIAEKTKASSMETVRVRNENNSPKKSPKDVRTVNGLSAEDAQGAKLRIKLLMVAARFRETRIKLLCMQAFIADSSLTK